VFRVAGGAVGDIAMSSSGSELPEAGDDVVVFLSGQEMSAKAVGLDAESDTLTPILLAPGQGWLSVRSGKVEVDGRSLPAEDFLTSVAEVAK
jgi:hypothetical protein